MLISIRFFNATITLPIRPLPEAFLMPTFSVDNLCFVSFNFKFSRRLAHSVITALRLAHSVITALSTQMQQFLWKIIDA